MTPLKGMRIKLSGTRCSSMSPSLYTSTKQGRDSPTHSGCQPRVESPKTDSAKTNAKSGRQPRNYSWAQLMMRVFEFDVLSCPRCGGRMRILCEINSPAAIQKILPCLGLPTRAPPIALAISDEDEFYQYQ